MSSAPPSPSPNVQSDGTTATEPLPDIENLAGSAYDDVLAGDRRDNVLNGHAGNDKLYGGPGGGDDTLSGGSGDDSLFGGLGMDMLTGQAGHDSSSAAWVMTSWMAATAMIRCVAVRALMRLIGGAGLDTTDYSGSDNAVTVRLHSLVAAGHGDAEGDTFGTDIVSVAYRQADGSTETEHCLTSRTWRGQRITTCWPATGGTTSSMAASGTIPYMVDPAAAMTPCSAMMATIPYMVDWAMTRLTAGRATTGCSAGRAVTPCSGGTATTPSTAAPAMIPCPAMEAMTPCPATPAMTPWRRRAMKARRAGPVPTASTAARALTRPTIHRSPAPVEINLSAAIVRGGDATGDALISIENLVGSAFDDTFTGDAGDNILEGGPGADTTGRRGRL